MKRRDYEQEIRIAWAVVLGVTILALFIVAAYLYLTFMST